MSSARHSGAGGSYTGSASPKTLTSERIAADIAAFNKAGGHIEVLGNTPLHRKPEETEASTNANNATAATKQSPGRK